MGVSIQACISLAPSVIATPAQACCVFCFLGAGFTDDELSFFSQHSVAHCFMADCSVATGLIHSPPPVSLDITKLDIRTRTNVRQYSPNALHELIILYYCRCMSVCSSEPVTVLDRLRHRLYRPRNSCNSERESRRRAIRAAHASSAADQQLQSKTTR